MDWSTENGKDARLLHLRGLLPLNAGLVAGDAELLALVEGHNVRTACAIARLRQLAEDRQRMAAFNDWQDKTGEDLVSERSRVQREAWDTLLELRRVLQEREELLLRAEQTSQTQYGDAYREHDQAVVAARRRLARERRRLERVNPGAADSHFAHVVAADELVQEAATRNTEMRRAFENAAEARRNIPADLCAVKTRQQEVFRALVG